MADDQNPKFRPNEIIFRYGDQGDCAYLIECGSVLIFVTRGDSDIPVKVLGEGEVFGEMSMIDGSLRATSSRSLTDTELVTVSRDQLLDRINSADPVVRLLMRALLEKFRAQNDTLAAGGTAPANPNLLPGEKIDQEKREALNRLELENRIATALKHDQLVPFYQPIYDLNTREIKGCEALVRWISNDGDVIPPMLFIDILEQSTLVLRAGRRIIEKCFADLTRLQTVCAKPEEFFLNINISGRQFIDPDFIDHLENQRQHHNLPAAQIKLELTERVMLGGPEALATLQKCRWLGYQLAIDDFGTGFSSLQYLASMPLTDLKIDRSFVMKMLTHDKSLSIVKSLVHMGRLLGMRMIAEGIESEAELKILRKLGVSMGQGFLFSKALPLREFVLLEATSLPEAAAKPKRHRNGKLLKLKRKVA